MRKMRFSTFVNITLCVTICLVTTVSSASLYYQPKHPHTDCYSRWKALGEREPGVYTIYPDGHSPVRVFCEHTSDNSFTVIQRRMIGTETFYRHWYDYRNGFGHAQADYWIGLEAMHHLTSTGNQLLRIDMQDWNGFKKYATYSYFYIYNETYGYYAHIGGFQGNLPDDMSFNNNMHFYTPDRPDRNYCASHMQAGWWFNYCSYAMLNGKYYVGGPYYPPGQYYDGIYWKDWRGYNYSLKFTTMALYNRFSTNSTVTVDKTIFKQPKIPRSN